MQNTMPDLSQRIAIIGLSSSGKSTLADTIGKKKNLPVFHLDQIVHIPASNWTMRPCEDWILEHDQIIQGEHWVMDGNYSIAMPQRLSRAQTLIWLDLPIWFCLYRYIKRCYANDLQRVGRLSDATREFSWKLIKYTLFNYPRNRKKHLEIIKKNSHLKFFHLRSLQELNTFYKEFLRLD